MSKESIKLSRVESSYPSEEGVRVRAEIDPFDPDIYAEPGVCLQIADGCGYTVYELTPEEAEAIAKALINAAAKTRKAFDKKGKVFDEGA